MQLQPRRGITISNLALYGLLLFAFLGWMFVMILFGKILNTDYLKLLSELGIEALKAGIIGTAAAIAVDRYLKHALSETPATLIKDAGMKHVYPSRQQGHPICFLSSPNRRRFNSWGYRSGFLDYEYRGVQYVLRVAIAIG